MNIPRAQVKDGTYCKFPTQRYTLHSSPYRISMEREKLLTSVLASQPWLRNPHPHPIMEPPPFFSSTQAQKPTSTAILRNQPWKRKEGQDCKRGASPDQSKALRCSPGFRKRSGRVGF